MKKWIEKNIPLHLVFGVSFVIIWATIMILFVVKANKRAEKKNAYYISVMEDVVACRTTCVETYKTEIQLEECKDICRMRYKYIGQKVKK